MVTTAEPQKSKASTTVPRFRTFVLGLFALLLAIVAQKRLYTGNVLDATVLFGLALLFFVIPFRAHLRPPLIVATKLGGQGGWSLLWRIVPGIAAMILAYFGLREFQGAIERPELLAWWFYIGSVLLFLLFAWSLDLGATKARNEQVAGERWQPWQIVIALLILFVALFMRLWRLDQLPFGTWYDEAENGLQALRILNDDQYYPLFVSSIHAPAHYLYLIALLFHYINVSTESIRLVSVLMGLATVWAGYLAGRELFGRSLGLATAFVIAVARWNVNFSRIGMYNASTPLFELLSIAFLLRGVRRGRYSDYAIAGLSLGLGLCFYAAFQIFIAATLLYLLLTALFQRGFLQRTWSGILLMYVTMALVIAPVALYAYAKPDVYFERTKDTSIFADKTPIENLPTWLADGCAQLSEPWADRCTRLPRLLDNARKHLLMFNWRGDPNGRHNLPGEPMLDNILAALLLLGVGLSLARFWRPRALLLLIWLFAMLMGGILSLGFEAPQSLRAIGTQPAAYLLALVPLHALWLAWRNSGGQRYAQWVALPIALLLLWAGYNNFYTYFYRQALDFPSWNAFSTPETLTANLLSEMDDQTEAYVISYFHGHPTLNFLAPNARPYHRLETTDHLPLDWPTDKNVALIANADSRTIFQEAKDYYPSGIFEEFSAPGNGPTVLYYAYLTQTDIAAVQGLTARYYGSEDWSGPPLIERRDASLQFRWPNDAPVAPPFSAEWEGVLNVKEYGTHQFFLQSPGQAALYIGESEVLSGTGELSTAIVLAQGKHTILVRAVGASGPFSLAWRPPDRGPEIIPASAFFVPPITSNGLLGTYYPNGNWQGPEALARIDPQLNLYFHIPPLLRPYTVEWTGKIAIPQGGLYRFGLESIDEAVLFIDEEQITSSPRPNEYQEGSIELTEGLHDIRLRFADRTDHTHINLYWSPPFAGQQPIPAEVLFPPQPSYDRVALPLLSQLTFNPDAPAAPVVGTMNLTGNVRRVAGGFASPKGVAVGPDNRLYVADTGNRRVVILSPDGETLGQLTPAEPFEEPFDLVVNGAGEIFVLDPTTEQISHFGADGAYLGDIPAEAGIVGRSRGIGIDPEGNLWIANTSAGRVVKIDADGKTLQTVPVWPGQESQPVDVAVGRDGSIFVTDSGLNKLIRFDATGQRLLAWELPVANTIDGSHLAVSESGYLHISKPEPFLIAQHNPDGEPIGDWSVASASGDVVKPVGIAVDELGEIWFVDTVNGTLYVIEVDSE